MEIYSKIGDALIAEYTKARLSDYILIITYIK